ncbi:DNA-binding transcriptional response regulator, NtrC family, contains REC, AAA-type ATPase, and a Fis-type DNA-binding domains [Monaibacterium marinum]|uniref:Nif-specific regulatory protein n=1 Tax=Pontivivens marinum TaxID=1690039 RepID=A0A2C9CUP3_9RHOB|nr:sigma-54 dependent transcriptional regulator [Monaibacterium marinum]SOH94119.1 DNA-binding transcriptional response regulator, NtrC family, contains REC, AAA-type ATPase, and a Fis-type DNA-binding domains [Monaibacterium marinum]
MTNTLLLVEDTPSLSLVYESVLKRSGYQVDCVFTARDARRTFDPERHGVVLLDMMLPDGKGQDILTWIKERSPDTRVIVITSNGSVQVAVEAMRLGAADFLVKPFDESRLRNAVANAQQGEDVTVPDIVAAQDTSPPLEGFIGQSRQMRDIYQTVRLIGRSTATVFVTGESGTGKEVCAHAIHANSKRADGPFIPLNCGAIPASLLESEVFGHLKGSFTGAISDKEGAATAADGGTLFLDEICEMDLNLQTKLLRFIQSSTVQPVGATRARNVDVRILCATNRDPKREVDEGRFREDLFYRLHVVPVHLPPLRERGDDVNLIAQDALSRFSHEEGKQFRTLSTEVQELFRTLEWRGNVRQLLNVVRNVVVLHDGQVVTREMLPPDLVRRTPSVVGDAAPRVITADNALNALVGRNLADMERSFIEATIAACDGSIPRAARMLEISPSTLYRKREAWERAAHGATG